MVNLFPFLHISHTYTPSHTYIPSHTTHLHTPHTFTHHTPSHSLSVAVALPVVWVPPAEEENFVSSLSGNLISRREREEGERGGREGRAEERGKEGEKNGKEGEKNGKEGRSVGCTKWPRCHVTGEGLTLFLGNLQWISCLGYPGCQSVQSTL